MHLDPVKVSGLWFGNCVIWLPLEILGTERPAQRPHLRGPITRGTPSLTPATLPFVDKDLSNGKETGTQFTTSETHHKAHSKLKGGRYR